MNEVVSSRSLDTPAHRSARWPKILALVVLVIGGLAGLVYHELRTSAIQSWLLSRYAASETLRQSRVEEQKARRQEFIEQRERERAERLHENKKREK